MSYEDYLRSPHWLATRERKLELENHCCERCGFFGRRVRNGEWVGLHVHHKTYVRRGREEMEDLEVLCVYCHECEHGLNRRSRDQIRASYVVPVLEHYDPVRMELDAWDRLAEAVF